MKYLFIFLVEITTVSFSFGQQARNDTINKNVLGNKKDTIYVFECKYQIENVLKVKSLFFKVDDCEQNPLFASVRLSDSISLYRNLEVLYLSSTKAIMLPDTFNCLKKIKNIEYSGPVTDSTLPQTFQLYNLETISFGNVMTSNFPAQLLKLPKLRMVGFDYSPLYAKEFRKFIKGLIKLESLENIHVMLPHGEDDKNIKDKRTRKDMRWLKRLMKKNKIECDV